MNNLALFENDPQWTESEWVARSVNSRTAKEWMRRFHYLGSAGTALYRFGIYPDGSDMIACVVVSGTTNTHGLGEKFPELDRFRGNLEITRVAVHSDAPKNAASRSVALAVSELHRLTGIEWLFSYADVGQGHHGGIYQALNSVYLGVNLGGKPPPRWEMLVNGQWEEAHARTIGKICGTARSGAVDRMAALGYSVRVIGESSDKHTYIIPCGSPKSRRQIRALLAPYAKPYPKRAEEGSRESRPVTDREGEVRFLDSAPTLETR